MILHLLENESLTAVLAGSPTTEPNYLTLWSDSGGSVKQTVGALDGTTAVTLVEAPQHGRLLVDWVHIYNADSAAITVTLSKKVGSTTHNILKVTLQTTEQLVFDGSGAKVVSSSGAILYDTATGDVTLSSITGDTDPLTITGLATGGALTITAGANTGTGAGGIASVVGGASGDGATGAGGAAKVTGGAAASTNDAGGAASVTGGAGKGTGAGGTVSSTSGTGANGTTGTAGASGTVTVDAGATGTATTGTGGAGGVVAITGVVGGATTGAGGTGGAGSTVTITAGAGGNDGDGTSGTGGAAGSIILDAGTGGTGNTAGKDGKIIARDRLFVNQGAPAAKTTSTTLTAAEILGGIITVNQGAAGASTLTMPLGTAIETAMPSDVANGDSFDFSLINISTVAAEDAVLAANTGVTAVGNLDVQSNDAATSKSAGLFRVRRTAANTYVL